MGGVTEWRTSPADVHPDFQDSEVIADPLYVECASVQSSTRTTLGGVPDLWYSNADAAMGSHRVAHLTNKPQSGVTYPCFSLTTPIGEGERQAKLNCTRRRTRTRCIPRIIIRHDRHLLTAQIRPIIWRWMESRDGTCQCSRRTLLGYT